MGFTVKMSMPKETCNEAYNETNTQLMYQIATTKTKCWQANMSLQQIKLKHTNNAIH